MCPVYLDDTHDNQVNQKKEVDQREFLRILSDLLETDSLDAAELVCKQWFKDVSEGMLWRNLIELKVQTDSVWRGLANKRKWIEFLFKKQSGKSELNYAFYKNLFPIIVKDIDNINNNWRKGRYNLQRINCRSVDSEGVYCMQYDDLKIVSGLRDNTIKIWDRNTLQCTNILTGHTGSVLCLQYDDKVIISGSSDSSVKVWDVNTGELLNTLNYHSKAVVYLKFNDDGMMITCSKDRSVVVWDVTLNTEIKLRCVLAECQLAGFNVVDFDEKYIVPAGADKTIRVWSMSRFEFVRTLKGHKRSIACLQYKNPLVVSGSSDNTIRLWDIETGLCLRVLEGHEAKVRCIRFDSKRIVSGSYDGKIKVWDLVAALDLKSVESTLCLQTLAEHTSRISRLQFDEFQIVSSSLDDTILIWDFLNFNQDNSCSRSTFECQCFSSLFL